LYWIFTSTDFESAYICDFLDKSELKFKLDISYFDQLITSEVTCSVTRFLNNILLLPTSEKYGVGGSIYGEIFLKQKSVATIGMLARK
jgi:hypothetical protein